jgi:hypothetical protein
MKLSIILKTLFSIIVLAIVTIGFITPSIAYDLESNHGNGVNINVIPLQLVTGKPIIFEIRMSTHSVELNYDLTAISILRDNKELEYQAIKWTGSPPKGHHRKGKLEFQPLKGKPDSVSLIIKGVANVPDRIFKWELEN